MNCHYCGTEVSGNALFCRHCGTRLQSMPTMEPVAEAEIAPVLEEAVAEPMPEVIPVPQPAPVFEERKPVWQPYGAPAPAVEEPLFDFEKAVVMDAPKLRLPTKRSLAKMIFLSILTLGIYPMVIWSRLVGEVNLVASRYDGERSMSFFGMIMLSPLTLGIHSLVWMNKLCRRIGTELQRRNIGYTFGAKDFWIWNFLLSFLFGICIGSCSALFAMGHGGNILLWILAIVGLLTLIGPFIFVHKLMKAMNKLNEDYNTNG